MRSQAEAAERTFKAAATALVASKQSGWRNGKHGAQWLATLESYAYPVIGDMPVADVRTDDVLRVLRPIWERVPETASRVRQRIEAVVCPTLAALILTYRERGTMGIAALLTRSFDGGQFSKRWFLPIVLLMPGVTVASFALERWTGVDVPVPHIDVLPAAALFLAFMVGALGEEIGLERLRAGSIAGSVGALSNPHFSWVACGRSGTGSL